MVIKSRNLMMLFLLITQVGIWAQTTDVLLPVKVDKKWGYVNLKGEIIIEPTFDAASEFNGKTLARATLNNKLVLINRKGEVAVEPNLKRITILTDSMYAGSADNINWGLYRLPFKEIVPPIYNDVQSSTDLDYFLIFKNKKCGLVNKDGKILVPPNFEKITFQSSYFLTSADSKFGAYTLTGKELLKPLCYSIVSTNFNYLFFVFNANWGCISLEGDTLLKPEFRKLEAMSAKYIRVTNHKEKIYSTDHKIYIYENFKGEVYTFNDTLLYLYNDFKYGLGNNKGVVLFVPEFQNIFILGNGFFVRRNDSVGIFSFDKKVIVPLHYKSVLRADSGFYIAKNGNIEALFSSSGMQLIPPAEQTITVSEGRIKVKSKDKIEVFKVSSNFRIEKDDEFVNVVTVALRKRVEYNDATRNPIVIPPPLIVSGGWFMNSKSKYGKVNANGDTIVKPIFDYYREYLSKDMAIVGIYKKDRMIFEISGYKYSYNYVVGMIQNSTGKFYVKPEYCYIDVESIKDSNFLCTRAISQQGLFCFVFKGRRPYYKQIAYIDTASNGLMRYCEEGRLTTIPNMPSKANYVSTLGEFLQQIGVMVYDQQTYSAKLYIEGGKWGFWSITNRANIAPQYQYLTPMYNNRSIVKQGNKYGLIDEQNNLVLNINYFYIELLNPNDFSNFKVWKENSHYGYISKQGDMLVAPVYTKLSLFKEGYCVARSTTASRFVDSSGGFLNDTLYQRANMFSEGIASVRINNRWGFINKGGERIIEPKFHNAGSFGVGLAPVKFDKRWGYINTSGETMIAFKYNYAGDFIGGVARVKSRRGKYGYINTSGKYVISPTYASATDFDANGLAKVRRFLGTSNFIKTNGMKANFFRFYKAGGFSEGRNILSRVNNYAIMDTTGKIVKRFKNTSKISTFKNGYAVIIKRRKYGIIDKEGNYIIKPVYKYLSDVNEKGLLVFSNGRKKGVINLRGQIILEPKCIIIGGCEHDILLQKDSKGYFYTDVKGLPIMDTRFQLARPFSDGVAKVYVNNNWALLNDKCVLVTNPKYAAIRKINSGLYKVEVSYFYGIVNPNGDFIIEPEYDFVALTKDNVFRVENGDRLGYLTRGGAWIWRTRN